MASGQCSPSQPHGQSLRFEHVTKTNQAQHRPFPRKRFNPEEWEEWMQWDGAVDTLSPLSVSDSSSVSFQDRGVSQCSTSPSETESLPCPPLTSTYSICNIEPYSKSAIRNTSESLRPINRKRKTDASVTRQDGRIRQPKGQKISHNVIEKRYRTNLNDKIARLRDSVPTLKTAFEASQRRASKEESGSEDSDSEDKNAAASLKFNKATVLTKATEYIEQLERANAKLLSENSTLRRRVKDNSSDVYGPKPLYFRADEANSSGSSLSNQIEFEIESHHAPVSPVSSSRVHGKIPVAAAFQRLRAEAADAPSYAPEASVDISLSPSNTAQGSEMASDGSQAVRRQSFLVDFDSVRGKIPIPDYLRNNRIPVSQQQHYAPAAGRLKLDQSDTDTFIMDDEETSTWWPRNRASKLLLGSLVGLMIMEGLSSSEEHPKKHYHPKRAYNFLPDDFYTESRGFRAQIRQRIIDFAHSPRGQRALPALLLCAAILGCICIAFIYLGHNSSRIRRRANSVSLKPELGDPSRIPYKTLHLICSDNAEGSLIAVKSCNRMRNSDQFQAAFGKVFSGNDAFQEVLSRLRACWRILLEGNIDPYRAQSSAHVPSVGARDDL